MSSAFLHSAFHPLRARRQDKICPKGCQHAPPLDAHGLGHGQSQLVPARRGHVGQGYPRVPAGGLDDLHTRFQDAAFFGVQIMDAPIRHLTE